MIRLQLMLASFFRALPRALTYVPSLIALCLGLLVTAILFSAIRTYEKDNRQVEFERRANNRIFAVKHGLDDAVEALASVNRFFNTVPLVTREQFRTFTAPMLNSAPQLRLIFFQRIVVDAERASFESERRVTRPGFAITALKEGKLIRAPRNDNYRVVDYMVPMAGNESAFGLDAGSRIEQDSAARRSCETGGVSMTNQYSVMMGNRLEPGFIMLMPVYRPGAILSLQESNCAFVIGYTGVAISSKALIEKTLASRRLLGQPEFNIRVYADYATDPRTLVFHVGDERGLASSTWSALLAERPRGTHASFEVGGHQWHIEIEAGRSITWLDSLGSLLMLATGCAGSLLTAAYIGVLTARTRSVFRLVKNRTFALTQANRSQQLLRQAIDACFNSIVIIRAEAPDYAIEYANPAFEKMTGYKAGEVVGRELAMLWGVDTADGGVRDIVAMVRQQREGIAVLRTYRKDGSMLWTEVNIAPVKDASGAVTHFVVVHSDVTEKRRYESELEYQATHDVLTGLVNRKLLSERLLQEIASAARHDKSVWVIFVDLDRFKFVNDSVGRLAGDQCLQQVAQRLAAAVRPEDTVARLGGDEFMLVLSERGEGRLSGAVLDRIMQAIARPITVDSQEFFLSGSLGIACYPGDSSDPDTLIEYADLAMYRAKQSGRDNYQFYLPELNQLAQERLHLETALRNALDRGEFELHYQPQLDLRSGRIVGVEALLRWRHPELGLLLPQRFLGLAEETGLIIPVGVWAMRRACAQVRAWQLEGCTGLRLALNLSARQFNEPDVLARIAQALDDTGLPAGALELELTERMVMNDAPRAIAVLRRLREMGVSVAVDDFGTGHSSLAQLKDFPLDALKIDQSFVREISSQGSDAAIPNAIISLAHNLGMRVIAEGVETEAQCEFLARNMCDEIQGALFSAPLEGDSCAELLNTGRALPGHLLRMHKRQRTLLLVDDEPNILSALKRQLRGTGLRILTAPGGKEGLAILESEAIDVIVSDQRMPGMTGVEFLRAVKTSHPDTVRIVLSGFTELQSVTDAVNEGAIYKFLTKPWDDTQLRGHIQEAVLHKEMADENRRLDLEVRTANHGFAQANRQLEEVLRQQQEQIARTGISLDIVREALQHVPLPILGLDEEQVVAFANLAAQDLFGPDGMTLGDSAELFMPQLLRVLDQAGEDQACIEQLHGTTFEISAHSMGKGTRSRGRLIILKPAQAVNISKEAA